MVSNVMLNDTSRGGEFQTPLAQYCNFPHVSQDEVGRCSHMFEAEKSIFNKDPSVYNAHGPRSGNLFDMDKKRLNET
jgi:hypothetical protein